MITVGRQRSFDERRVLASAATAFTDLGYEATSVDDLLQATGLHRGSLYQAFGSKRGLFLSALRSQLAAPAGTETATSDLGVEAADLANESLLDLLLIATLELAPRDDEVRDLIARAITECIAPDHAALVLGRRLLARAHIAPAQPD